MGGTRRAAAEDGGAVDTPGVRRLSGLFWGDGFYPSLVGGKVLPYHVVRNIMDVMLRFGPWHDDTLE